MKFLEYRDHVKALKHGKQLPIAIYLHRSAIVEVLAEPLLFIIY